MTVIQGGQLSLWFQEKEKKIWLTHWCLCTKIRKKNCYAYNSLAPSFRITVITLSAMLEFVAGITAKESLNCDRYELFEHIFILCTNYSLEEENKLGNCDLATTMYHVQHYANTYIFKECACTHAHKYTHKRTGTCTRASTWAHTHTHTHIHTRTQKHTFKHTHTRTQKHTYTQTHTHTCTHTQDTYMHAKTPQWVSISCFCYHVPLPCWHWKMKIVTRQWKVTTSIPTIFPPKKMTCTLGHLAEAKCFIKVSTSDFPAFHPWWSLLVGWIFFFFQF